jgi:hypothetical protein
MTLNPGSTMTCKVALASSHRVTALLSLSQRCCVCRYSFDIARRRWYELEVKEKTAAVEGVKKVKRRNPKSSASTDEGSTTISAREDDSVFGDGFDEGEDDDAAAATVESFDDNAYYYWENGELKKMDMTEGEDEPDGVETTAAAPVLEDTEPPTHLDEPAGPSSSDGVVVPSSDAAADVAVETPIACGAGVDSGVLAGLAVKAVGA